MKTEFLIAITQLSAEKNLPKEAVLQAVESALVPAFKKEGFAPNQNITVKIHPATGDMKVYVLKTVVEEVADPGCDISLSDAKRIKPTAKLGDVVEVESTPKHTGRIAAQTAKQVILQRLREAEREAVFEEYAGKKDDILGGVVQRIEFKQITINLGKAEAILPISEQMKTDHYRVGQRVKVYLLDVLRTNKGPQLVVSRAHRNLLRRLFELEVPEIHSGTVEVKAIAREAGSRSKVAVASRQEGLDPVGATV
ncbi:MAG: transcription termination factor NusA, partial [Chloroflexota bacterium]|nr:transcription termination factor NusA [Chloroflexota bacterium]